jgi:hypothetical protein
MSDAGDVEIRWNVTDGQGKNMNDLELVKMTKAFIRWFETNGSTNTAILRNHPGRRTNGLR